jgi:hypothetical protein
MDGDRAGRVIDENATRYNYAPDLKAAPTTFSWAN